MRQNMPQQITEGGTPESRAAILRFLEIREDWAIKFKKEK